jgi:hypothetical protein
MNARKPLPSWFWMLLCAISLFGALLAWASQWIDANQRRAAPPAALNADANPNPVPPAPVPDGAGDSKPNPDLSVAPAAANSAGAQAPRILPADAGSGTKVRRCTIRGRVTYIDASSACADGSAGKITVLPN